MQLDSYKKSFTPQQSHHNMVRQLTRMHVLFPVRPWAAVTECLLKLHSAVVLVLVNASVVETRHVGCRGNISTILFDLEAPSAESTSCTPDVIFGIDHASCLGSNVWRAFDPGDLG